MTNPFTLPELLRLANGRSGEVDVPCPACGPDRRSPVNRVRPVLRLYVVDGGFVGYVCARCGAQGYARDRDARPPDPDRLARARREAAILHRAAAADRQRRSQWLFGAAGPGDHPLSRRYFAEVRNIDPALIPATIRFLPARGEHPPAIVTAFAIPEEPEPGVLHVPVEAVRAVHLTRLRPDGSGKAEGPGNPKIMVGPAKGTPLVLAPMNDLLGLAIVEGIEDALSIHQATGLGAWAAGAASMMPALADVAPYYTDCISVIPDADPDGQRHAGTLVNGLRARGLNVEVVDLARGVAA